MKKIYQIQIALQGFSPKIWRRILVDSDTLLSNFHDIIQITMGWEDCHLHQFIKDRKFYTLKMEDDFFWDEMRAIDYKTMEIADLLQKEKDKMLYEYDFGDGWAHDIILEKILPVDESTNYPVCLAGKMNCPPEDCGGVWGYASMLDILQQPDHEEYEHYTEWLGEEFDPEYFDKDEINNMLRG